REEHHHVQRYAEEVEQGEGDEHAQGDGEAYEEGIAQAQEEHEHAHHEDHPEDDVVEQLAHAQAGVLALVTGDGDDEVLGQHAAVVLGDDGVDAVAGSEQVAAGARDHVEHHHALAEVAGEALWFLEGEVHRGDIAQAHLALVLVLHHDVAHLLHVVELAHHAHAAALVLGEQVAAAEGEVLGAQGVLDVGEAQLQRFHAVEIHAHAHLAFGHATDLHLVHLGQRLDALLQVLAVFMELLHGEIPAEVDVHHRDELREVHLEHIRLGRQIRGEVSVAPRLVHGILHLAQRLGGGHIIAELHVDGAEVGHTGALDLVHPADGVDLLLDRLGDQFLDVHHRAAVVGSAHEHLGGHHLGEAHLGHHDVGVDPH